jgi:hypothetical protein
VLKLRDHNDADANTQSEIVSDNSLVCRLRDVRNSGSENLFPKDVKRTNNHQNMQHFTQKSL